MVTIKLRVRVRIMVRMMVRIMVRIRGTRRAWVSLLNAGNTNRCTTAILPLNHYLMNP